MKEAKTNNKRNKKAGWLHLLAKCCSQQSYTVNVAHYVGGFLCIAALLHLLSTWFASFVFTLLHFTES